LRYVYLVESRRSERSRYVGVTDDLRRRLADHNAGRSSHTAKHRPWRLIAYLAFAESASANAFERYLKSGSGHAFARRRLWEDR